jgi:hypothetical protein
MRTGMVEAGLRAWDVDRQTGSTVLVGFSVARLFTDNVSAGLMVSEPDLGHLDRAFLIDGMVRTYFLPLQSWTPWLEGRAGGLVQPRKGTGASHIAAGFGVRWRPLTMLALDLQLAGFERWGYNDPTEGSNGTAEWLLQKFPYRLSLFGDGGWRILPIPSFQILF